MLKSNHVFKINIESDSQYLMISQEAGVQLIAGGGETFCYDWPA